MGFPKYCITFKSLNLSNMSKLFAITIPILPGKEADWGKMAHGAKNNSQVRI